MEYHSAEMIPDPSHNEFLLHFDSVSMVAQWFFDSGFSSRIRLSKLRLILSLYKCQKKAKEGCRCYSEKFTIFQAIFDLYSWNWSLWWGAHVVMEGIKFFFFLRRNAVVEVGGKFEGFWYFLCRFYSEKFTIFGAIYVIFCGNWILDASATFGL